ncbi:MAG TPA: recombinase family protein, partial [Archangium sp.]|nr:recombinase family protein [Archangium sp.]
APAEIRWHVLDIPHALSILRNPVYAGAYAWGRNRDRRVLVEGAVRRKHETLQEPEQWHAFLRDAHPAYLSWEQYLENLKRLEDNAVRGAHVRGRGAPRGGPALLQGLVLCGKCGRRMSPVYSVAADPSYQCSRHIYGEGNCWSTVARRIDDKLVETLLAAFAPPELDLSLAVLKEVERQAEDVNRQWKLRLERVRYEAQRAERQYNAVEPENRVVARTLESRWNQKLEELARVEHEYEQARSTRPLELSDKDKKKILTLAGDLPGLWNAPTTTNADKKRILRLLIQEVVLSPVDVPKRATRIHILWKTGTITELETPRPTFSESRRTPPEVIAAVRELTQQHSSDWQIAKELNRRGLKSGLRHPFTRKLVAGIRKRQDIHAGRPPGACSIRVPERDEQGLYSIRGLSAHFGVTAPMVLYWVRRGLITPVHSRTPMHRWSKEPFWFEMTPGLEALLARAREQGYAPGNPPHHRGHSHHPRPPARLPDGRYSTRGLVEKYGVTWETVRYWIRKGILTPERALPRGSFCFRLTPEVERSIESALARGKKSRGSKQPHRRHINSS